MENLSYNGDGEQFIFCVFVGSKKYVHLCTALWESILLFLLYSERFVLTHDLSVRNDLCQKTLRC